MRSEFDALLTSKTGRRTFLKYMALSGGLGVLAACQKNVTKPNAGGSASGSPRPPIGDEPGVLHPYEWAGFEIKAIWKQYATAGYPDPKFSFFTNTEQALAKTAGGYTWDTVHPEVGYVQDYANIGAVQPWDTSLISNFPDLNPVLEKAGQLEGKQYEIVTDWGYSGVIIRTDHVDPSINSYSYLFDDNLAGHISWFDSPWLLMQAGLVLGVQSDIFDMTDADLQACKDYCILKKKNLYNIWVDFTAMWDDVKQGNVWSAYAWPDAWLNTYKDAPTAVHPPQGGSPFLGRGADAECEHRELLPRARVRQRMDERRHRHVGDQQLRVRSLEPEDRPFEDRPGDSSGIRARQRGGEPLGTGQSPRPLPAESGRVQPGLGRGQGRLSADGGRGTR